MHNASIGAILSFYDDMARLIAGKVAVAPSASSRAHSLHSIGEAQMPSAEHGSRVSHGRLIQNPGNLLYRDGRLSRLSLVVVSAIVLKNLRPAEVFATKTSVRCGQLT